MVLEQNKTIATFVENMRKGISDEKATNIYTQNRETDNISIAPKSININKNNEDCNANNVNNSKRDKLLPCENDQVAYSNGKDNKNTEGYMDMLNRSKIAPTNHKRQKLNEYQKMI